jgi:hypothetical protein
VLTGLDEAGRETQGAVELGLRREWARSRSPDRRRDPSLSTFALHGITKALVKRNTPVGTGQGPHTPELRPQLSFCRTIFRGAAPIRITICLASRSSSGWIFFWPMNMPRRCVFISARRLSERDTPFMSFCAA